MDTMIWILIVLIVFNFLLKQTFWPAGIGWIAALSAGAFTIALWPFAIEQSKTQIADWLSDSALMLDTAVVLTVEVALQMTFCLLSVHVDNVFPVRKKVRFAWKLLYWFPGLLIIPVLFWGLTQLLFALPGISFQQVAWGLGGAVFIGIPLGRWLIRSVVPERDLRLELLFLTNALVAVLGIVTTVNGRTAVEGVAAVNGQALVGCLGIFVLGAVSGMLTWKWRRKKIR